MVNNVLPVKSAGYQPSHLACLEDNGPSGNILEAQQGKRVGWPESLSLSVKHPCCESCVRLMGLLDGGAVPAVCPPLRVRLLQSLQFLKGMFYCVSVRVSWPACGGKDTPSPCRPQKSCCDPCLAILAKAARSRFSKRPFSGVDLPYTNI